MSQSLKHSTIETALNIGSGFFLSMTVWNFIAAPVVEILGGNLKAFHVNFIITCIFTVSSFLRSLAWRRGYNHWQNKKFLN